jgi:hypothetical protein
MQTTSHLLMIRPVNFCFNTETAVNNAFQTAGAIEQAQEKALAEFDDFVDILSENGIDVTVVNDTQQPFTPDSIFPNNWISFHENGTVCLFPMYAPNRRQERKPAVIEAISDKFNITKTIDFSHYEGEDVFLEGTGSMVLDREKMIAYACISPRTHNKALKDFCDKMSYQPEVFESVDAKGQAVYHTNVMMCVADKFVVICLDSVPSVKERERLIRTIENSGKKVIAISFDQMNHFAGNMLQVNNENGENLLIMSTQAYESLTAGQVQILESFSRIVHSSLMTIETNGGGSARCMMAEVYLPEK